MVIGSVVGLVEVVLAYDLIDRTASADVLDGGGRSGEPFEDETLPGGRTPSLVQRSEGIRKGPCVRCPGAEREI